MRTMAAKDQKTLSTDDICAILKAASDAQVRVLKYGGLYLEFGRKADSAEASAEAPAPRVIGQRAGQPLVVAPKVEYGTISVPATEIAEIQKQQAAQARAEDEILAREAQMEEALIEDPALFEQLLEAGELEPNGSAAISDDSGE
jgi:hypothetical protein